VKRLLEKLLSGQDLTEAQAGELFAGMTGESAEPPMTAALLAALRAKGETPDEVRGFVTSMRRAARRPPIPADLSAIDIVGTGGDGSNSVNISTGAALLVAACGKPVVKHGNRSVSSRSGSADVLEALGIELPEDEEGAVRCLRETGFSFLFAPHFHPAMARLAPVRRSLGVRTVFNLLGPLTNPAEPPFGVIGAFSGEAAFLMAQTLSGLPIQRVFVIHGARGWDEATPVGPFYLFDVRPGQVRRERRDPSHYGLDRCGVRDLRGGDAKHNARELRAVFEGRRGAHRDALVLNAALALEVSGAADRIGIATAMAEQAIDSGAAAGLVDRLAGRCDEASGSRRIRRGA
jgi:anthranilate phosphoribosyltransferase